MSIVEFLLDRIEEDEAAARAAVGNDGPPTWLQDNADGVYGVRPDVDWDEVCQSHAYGVPNECDFNPTACGISMTDDRVLEHARAVHIARHDPTRVLAECAAKRQTVAYFAEEIEYTGLDRQRMTDDQFRRVLDAERTLGWLAQPYADHPDFNPAWR